MVVGNCGGMGAGVATQRWDPPPERTGYRPPWYGTRRKHRHQCYGASCDAEREPTSRGALLRCDQSWAPAGL